MTRGQVYDNWLFSLMLSLNQLNLLGLSARSVVWGLLGRKSQKGLKPLTIVSSCSCASKYFTPSLFPFPLTHADAGAGWAPEVTLPNCILLRRGQWLSCARAAVPQPTHQGMANTQVCVYVYSCVCAHVCACVRVCVCVCMCAYACVRMRVCTCVCLYVRMCVCMCVSMHVHVCVFVNVYVRVSVCVCVCAWVHTRALVYITFLSGWPVVS